jgi:hypothetical protein
MLQDVIKRKDGGPDRARELVVYLQASYGIGERRL